MTINDEFSASIVVARCRHTRGGSRRWKIKFDAALKADITIAIRMDPSNTEVLDYYLLPRIDLGPKSWLKIKEDGGVFIDAYRSTTLEAFYQLGARTPIGGVA